MRIGYVLDRFPSEAFVVTELLAHEAHPDRPAAMAPRARAI
jgi:hypothetical protein